MSLTEEQLTKIREINSLLEKKHPNKVDTYWFLDLLIKELGKKTDSKNNRNSKRQSP